jgi:hypothetical protein
MSSSNNRDLICKYYARIERYFRSLQYFYKLLGHFKLISTFVFFVICIISVYGWYDF